MAGQTTITVQPDSQGTQVNTLPAVGPDTPANSLPMTLDTAVETAVGTAGTKAVTVQGGGSGAVPIPTITSTGKEAASADNQTTEIAKLQAIVDALSNGATNVGQPGNPSTDTLTIQGIANMTPVAVNLALAGVPVTPAAPVSVAGPSSAVGTASFTRPNSTVNYSLGKIIANSATASSVTPMPLTLARVNDGTFKIHGLRLKTTDTSLSNVNAAVRVHLYKMAPTVSFGDGGNFVTTESNWIGAVDISLSQSFSDMVKGVALPADGADFLCDPSTGTQNIFALLEARSSFALSTASTWTVAVPAMRD